MSSPRMSPAPSSAKYGVTHGYHPLPGWDITPSLVIQPSHLPLHHPTAAFFHSMALPTTQPTPVSLAPPPGCDCGGCRCHRPACRRHPTRRNTGLRTATTPTGVGYYSASCHPTLASSAPPPHRSLLTSATPHPTAASSPPPRHHATAASSPPPRRRR